MLKCWLLIGAGRFDEAELLAENVVVKYTDAAAGWSNDAGVEFFLRDCVFNRGPTGAAWWWGIEAQLRPFRALQGQSRFPQLIERK